MRVLVDTNILLRAAQPNHPQCSQSTRAVSKLLRQGESLFFCPQNVAEFWNVATRPTEHNGLGLSPNEALREVGHLEEILTLLPDIPAIYETWKNIVGTNGVQGVKVYDARLVATMMVYGVGHVLTFNASDFARYADIQVIHPSSMAPA